MHSSSSAAQRSLGRQSWESSLQPPGPSLPPKPRHSPSLLPAAPWGRYLPQALLCASSPSALPLLQVRKEFPTMNRTHLRDTCAASAYTLSLLLQGYKFNDTTWPNIHFVQQVGEWLAAPSFHFVP